MPRKLRVVMANVVKTTNKPGSDFEGRVSLSLHACFYWNPRRRRPLFEEIDERHEQSGDVRQGDDADCDEDEATAEHTHGHGRDTVVLGCLFLPPGLRGHLTVHPNVGGDTLHHFLELLWRESHVTLIAADGEFPGDVIGDSHWS